MASSLMASQTLILRTPNFLSPHSHSYTTLSLPSPPKPLLLSKPRTLSLLSPPIRSLSNPKPSIPKPTPKNSSLFASSSSSTIPNNSSIDSSENPTQSLLAGSTRTISTILAVVLSVSRLFVSKVFDFTSNLNRICANPSSEELATIQKLHGNLVCTVGPLFFAALKDRPSGYLNTPLTVVASGMSKWLDIYSGVLMVRVLLSWFPNIPWDRQPFVCNSRLVRPVFESFQKYHSSYI